MQLLKIERKKPNHNTNNTNEEKVAQFENCQSLFAEILWRSFWVANKRLKVNALEHLHSRVFIRVCVVFWEFLFAHCQHKIRTFTRKFSFVICVDVSCGVLCCYSLLLQLFCVHFHNRWCGFFFIFIFSHFFFVS